MRVPPPLLTYQGILQKSACVWRWRKTSICRHAVAAEGLGKNLGKSGSCPRMEWVISLSRADQKGGALREIESALIKGFLFASVVVVIHSVWFFITKFSFGLLAKQKQKVVSSTFVSIFFYLILIHNSQDFHMDLLWLMIWRVVFSSRQNMFPHMM